MLRVLVVGAGASGLMAAYAASKDGVEVTVIEPNLKAGKKIYITGKGRCNLTNLIASRDFLDGVVTGKKFLHSAIYSFSPESTVDFFEKNGVKLKTERGGRVFPLSDKASDITGGLLNALKKNNCTIKYGERVLDINTQNNGFRVNTDKDSYFADRVIVATGGKSYSATGSSGDGYEFAKKFGHTINRLRPALCGIEIKQDLCSQLQGLSLKNVRLTAYDGGQICSFFGEMIFTHYGISGPIVLSSSSEISAREAFGAYLSLDLKPALDFNTLSARLVRDFEKNKTKLLSNSLFELLPKKLIPHIIQLSGVSGDKKVSEITREERLSLCNTLKDIRLEVKSLRPIEECIVTGGGISTAEINPSSMESKLVKGLFFCGEVLDIDAYTGGYNMQIAFSTGFLAGTNAAETN